MVSWILISDRVWRDSNTPMGLAWKRICDAIHDSESMSYYHHYRPPRLPPHSLWKICFLSTGSRETLRLPWSLPCCKILHQLTIIVWVSPFSNFVTPHLAKWLERILTRKNSLIQSSYNHPHAKPSLTSATSYPSVRQRRRGSTEGGRLPLSAMSQFWGELSLSTRNILGLASALILMIVTDGSFGLDMVRKFEWELILEEVFICSGIES